MQNSTSVGLKQLRLWCVAALLSWSLLLTGSLYIYVKHDWQSVEFVGKKIGLTAVHKDYIYELWNARNGGVYTPVSNENQPNPYLANRPERNIITPSGRKLTLINPAHMTRQVYQLEKELHGISGHITSLETVSPQNAADDWERKALLSFIQGEEYASELIQKENTTVMRVMVPAITQKTCLQCHMREGDQVGDIRGGISITFPVDGIMELFDKQFKTSALYHMLIYLMGAAGLLVFYIQTSKQIKKRADIEKQLRHQTEEWQNTFDAIPDIITLQDSEMRIIRANQAAHDFFENSPEKLVGSSCYKLFQKGEQICPGCSGVGSIPDGYQHCNTVDHKILGKSFHICSAPVLDEQGKLEYLVYIARDITEKKKLEEELFQARKMEAIGTLAGGIAHDFNNILAAILGYTEMIQFSLPKGSPLEEDLNQIIIAGNRAIDLIKQILTFSRKKKQQKEKLEINQAVKEVVKMMRSSLPASIDIQENIAEQCGIVLADRTNIHQIVLNLLTNGFHAIGNEQGILKVSLQPVEISPDYVTDNPKVKAGSFVELTVQDNGKGMDDVTMGRIFDPYFTTKEQGAGTGLGLAVIHGIVEDCKGFIEVESSAGQGTSFHVYLPLQHGEKKKKPKILPSSPLPVGNERILFVDDEIDITRISQSLLSNLGYRVTVESQSIKALEIFQQSPEDFDLLITDHTMPGLTGKDLAYSVLQLRPNLPIILCTGYTSAFSKKEALELGIKKYMIKPLSTRKLAEIVREVLDESISQKNIKR